MGSGNKLKVEGIMELSQALAYLEQVVASLKQGAIAIEAGEETITLSPENVVEFEMEASQKKDKEKFALEISWKKDGSLIKEGDVKISTK